MKHLIILQLLALPGAVVGGDWSGISVCGIARIEHGKWGMCKYGPLKDTIRERVKRTEMFTTLINNGTADKTIMLFVTEGKKDFLALYRNDGLVPLGNSCFRKGDRAFGLVSVSELPE